MNQDEQLIGNNLIEEKISIMYKSLTDENLFEVVKIIRKRISEEGHFVVAVKATEGTNLSLRPVRDNNDKLWFTAFTSFDEALKGKDPIVSGFTSDIKKLFEIARNSEEVDGVMLNPWGQAMKIDKNLIDIILS